MGLLYGVLAVFALFIIMQKVMVLKMKLKKGKPAPDLGGHYAKAAGGGGALFYFYSEGCGACRPMTPIIGELSKKRKDVFKVDITRDMATARKFGVMATPSTVLVRDGKIAEFLVGPLSRERILGLLP